MDERSQSNYGQHPKPHQSRQRQPFFPWIRRRSPVGPRKFAKLPTSPHLVEFAGQLPNTPQYLHRLFCCAIEPSHGLQLAGQQNSAIGAGRIPSHAIVCVFKFVDASGYRVLFTCYLCLNGQVDGNPIADSATADRLASKIAKDVAQHLTTIDRMWLVRCTEYPWCVSFDVLDEYWQMQIAAFFRFRANQSSPPPS